MAADSYLYQDGSLDDGQLQHFARQGYVRLGRVVTTEQLLALQQRIDDIMQGRLVYPTLTMQLDSRTGAYEDMPQQTRGFKGATAAYRKIEGLECDPRFLAYLQLPFIRDICQRLIGPEVAIYRSMFMNKPAGQGTLLPWHQDSGAFWGLSQNPTVTIWLALDPATRENGCVQVIPGSHRRGLLSQDHHLLSPDDVERFCQPEQIDYVDMAAGEAVLLHNFLFHRSDRNASQQSRRAFSVCLMDAGTRNLRRPSVRYPQLLGPEALEPGRW